MKKKNIGEEKDMKVILPIFMIGLGVVLFCLEIFNATQSLKNVVHTISDPVVIKSESVGKSVSDYFQVLLNIPGTQKEINDLRLKLLTYESKVAYVSILEEENEALRKQLNLANEKHKYVEAKILGKVVDNTIRISAGRKQSIATGDTVTLGYNFVGIVAEVMESTSIVRLPYSKSSALEVLVVSQSNQQDILSKAVVIGSGEEYMLIENISKNAGVVVGDYIIVDDERIIDNLILGKISKLNTDPADISVSGEVVSLLPFDDLISVFVCIE